MYIILLKKLGTPRLIARLSGTNRAFRLDNAQLKYDIYGRKVNMRENVL